MMDNKKTNQEIQKSAIKVHSHLVNTGMTAVSNKTNIICLKSSIFMKAYEIKILNPDSRIKKEIIEYLCANLAQSRISYNSVQDRMILSAFFDEQDIEAAYYKFEKFEKEMDIFSNSRIDIQNMDIKNLLKTISVNFDKQNKKLSAKEILITRGSFKTKILPSLKSTDENILYESASGKYVTSLCCMQYPEKGVNLSAFLKLLKDCEIQSTLELFRYSEDEWQMYCNYLAKRYNTRIDVDKQRIPVTTGMAFVIKHTDKEKLDECVDKFINYAKEQNYVISPVFKQTKALYEDIGALGTMPRCQKMRNTNINVVKELL